MRHWFGLLFLAFSACCVARAEYSCAQSSGCTNGWVPDYYDSHGCLVCKAPGSAGSGGGGGVGGGSSDVENYRAPDPGNILMKAMGKAVQDKAVEIMQDKVKDLFRPDTPEEKAAREQREEELRRAAAEAAERKRQEEAAADTKAAELIDQKPLDQAAAFDGDMELLSRVPATPKDRAGDPSHQCIGAAGDFTCITLSCGGTNQQPICCKKSHPYLNGCDCKCYPSSADIKDCSRYTACQYMEKK